MVHVAVLVMVLCFTLTFMIASPGDLPVTFPFETVAVFLLLVVHIYLQPRRFDGCIEVLRYIQALLFRET